MNNQTTSLTCRLSGEEEQINQVKLRKQLANPSILEQYKKYFICSRVKELLKRGKKIEQIVDTTNLVIDPDIFAFNGIEYEHSLSKYLAKRAKNNDEEAFKTYVESISKNDICHRPDIYLDSDRSCVYCKMNKYCLAEVNKFRKE